MKFTTFPPIELVNPKHGIVRELFAREGETVLMLTRGRGVTRIDVTEAQTLVTEHGVKLTLEHVRVLGINLGVSRG